MRSISSRMVLSTSMPVALATVEESLCCRQTPDQTWCHRAREAQDGGEKRYHAPILRVLYVLVETELVLTNFLAVSGYVRGDRSLIAAQSVRNLGDR